ncbi:MAG: hypothetical protein BGO01_04025 [Armatimonadetes bacterium 55-13]|nr:hypothetical protein [Armatimonadota bacterium]OJU63318.1 MAG: hypothetical protein BGO01_04025 [Armatimonadetes bacterium 55-13]
MIRRLCLGLVVVCAWIALLSAYSFAQQRGRTLEDRVSSLEYEVSLLKRSLGGGARTNDPSRYPFTGVGRSYPFAAALKNGATVLLDKELLWEIRPEDRARVMRWTMNQSICVSTSSDRDYPYLLENQSRREQVAAKYSGRSVY